MTAHFVNTKISIWTQFGGINLLLRTRNKNYRRKYFFFKKKALKEVVKKKKYRNAHVYKVCS